MASPSSRPITLALIDDYDVVVVGVAHMFNSYEDRIKILELDVNTPLTDRVDIVMYDSFAQPQADHVEVASLVSNPLAGRVVVYTWNFHPDLIRAAYDNGAHGYLSKTLPARELVEALETIHAGTPVTSPAPSKNKLSVGLDWPGRTEGLSEREAEILALITQGRTNDEIADLVYLSINSIKTYIRSAYKKIGVTTRVQAVLWGVDHGFTPDYHRIDHWIPSDHRR
jgi:DNA-binding NarL/FixJ family response regulator